MADQDNRQQPSREPAAPARRKPYEAPALTEFGSIADLTQTGGNTKTDTKGSKQRVN
jgi:hypothetical protein